MAAVHYTRAVEFPLTREQRDLQARAREVADNEFSVRAARWDEDEEYPWENVERLVDEGWMGLSVPAEYGGREHCLLDVILLIEAVARACGITGRILVDSNLGPVGAIVHWGSQDQKRRYLPRVVKGDKPAIAITESGAGSAASDLETTARVEGGHLVLNGKKRWITGAGISDIYVVLCRFDSIPGSAGIGAVIVESDSPGLIIGNRERAMGMRGIPEAEVILEKCRVPQANLLMGPGSFRQLMTAYNGQRLGASAVALGLAQGAFEQAVRYAGEREQFGRPIGTFQGLRWMIADMAMRIEAARQLIYRTADNAGRGLPDMAEAAMCKTVAAEMALWVTNQAVQIFGANGYSRDFPLERIVRDARMFTIGGGTVEMLRNVIANRFLGRLESRERPS